MFSSFSSFSRDLSRPETTRPRLPWGGLAYATAFGVVATFVDTRSVPVRDASFAWSSTNLANLADHPVRALVGSAFVTDDSVSDWMVLAFVGLVVAGRALGNARLVVVLAACHVLGTMISESVVDLQVDAGMLPASARFIRDIGPSYVVAPALVLGILRGSTVGRIACGICFALLAPHLFGGLDHLEVSSVGHVVAIGTALLISPRLSRWSSRSP